MQDVKLRKFRLLEGKLPGPVEVVVADHAERDVATVWIEARLLMNTPEQAGTLYALNEVLVNLQELVQTAKQNLSSTHYI